MKERSLRVFKVSAKIQIAFGSCVMALITDFASLQVPNLQVGFGSPPS